MQLQLFGPMLVAFLGVPAYEAVGIGLVSDVLASAVSAYTYKKERKSGRQKQFTHDD